MALTKVKNSNLEDQDLVALSGNDGSNLTGVVKPGDIGSTVEAYDATILKDADIGSTVEAYDATILKDADVGTTANKLVQLDGTAKLPAVDGSALTNLPAGGKILQVVSYVYTGYTTVASSTFTSVPVSVNITPSATSSKILIMVSGGTIAPDDQCSVTVAQVYRDSTALSGASFSCNIWVNHGSHHPTGSPASITYLDSPATTSEITYQLYVKEESGGSSTIYINYYGRGDMTITAMEIAV